MSDKTNLERVLLHEIRLNNLLSFGPETMALSLKPLNVLIGPNGAGKSNLIESLALMRATPVLPQTTSNADVRGVLRRGGGAAEWLWKGRPETPASVEVVVSNPKGSQPLRHRFSFWADQRNFRLDDERVENASAYANQRDPYFYYRFQNGHPVVNVIQDEFAKPKSVRDGGERLTGTYGQPKSRALARETVNLEVSILAQRRDPELYPEITYLADMYEKWRFYREWAFGRNTVFREPQRSDMGNGRLEEDFSNLGLFLSRLRRSPKVKTALVEGLRDLYDGLSDFDVNTESGTVQVLFTEGEFSIPATRLSDGTLRYMCLLAILCDPEPPPLICIEEPELGLHPDIIPKVADLLREASTRTQLLVTTHSDILVDAMSKTPEAVVVCSKREGRTSMERLNQVDLGEWLKEYRLGQLWMKGQIGGTRW